MKRLTKQYADTKRYYSTHNCDEVVQRLGKLEEAIEIIKDKTEMYLDNDYLVLGVPYDVFEDLTQEEYDLLKEVLEDE